MRYVVKQLPVKRSRKSHTCFGCQEIILEGSTLTYFLVNDYGKFWDYRLCSSCDNFILDCSQALDPEVFFEGGLIGLLRKGSNF